MYEEHKKMLSENVCKVLFTKKDGTKRTIIGTTNIVYIPASACPSGFKEYSENPEVCKIFDFIAYGWRSFRWDSLISLEEFEE